MSVSPRPRRPCHVHGVTGVPHRQLSAPSETLRAQQSSTPASPASEASILCGVATPPVAISSPRGWTRENSLALQMGCPQTRPRQPRRSAPAAQLRSVGAPANTAILSNLTLICSDMSSTLHPQGAMEPNNYNMVQMHHWLLNDLEQKLESCSQNSTAQADLLKAIEKLRKEKTMLDGELQRCKLEAVNEAMRKEVEDLKTERECLQLEQQIQKLRAERRKAALQDDLKKEQLMAAAGHESNTNFDDVLADTTEQLEPPPEYVVMSSSTRAADAEVASQASTPHVLSAVATNGVCSGDDSPLTPCPLNSTGVNLNCDREFGHSQGVVSKTPCLLSCQQSMVRLDKPRRLL